MTQVHIVIQKEKFIIESVWSTFELANAAKNYHAMRYIIDNKLDIELFNSNEYIVISREINKAIG